jgi:GDP-L-fucose synthase
MAHLKQELISGNKICAALRQRYSFDPISLMPTNLYGPGDNYHATNSHVLPAMIRRFYGAKDFQQQLVTGAARM